jgi:alkanesulfonate monooxygenase
VEFGRSPDDIKVMPGLFTVVGHTEQEAKDKFEQLQNLVHPQQGLSILSAMIGGGVDLSVYPLDGPVPDLPRTEGMTTFQSRLLEVARRDNLTLRQLSLRYASGSGHRQLIGTPAQIVDAMEETFMAHGADGFAMSSPYLPGGVNDIAAFIVPELQRRGLFRLEYEGATLRENLGLKTPVWRRTRPNATAKTAS